MAFNNKGKKTSMVPFLRSNLCTTFFFIVLFTVPAFFLLHTTTTISMCSSIANAPWSWSGDLRQAEFAWNRLHFSKTVPPPRIPQDSSVFQKMADE
ncbi:unnamed protein product [Rhodiola kirilowii]